MGSGKLEVGQWIELREQGHGFTYSIVSAGGTGQAVLEVGLDFIVVKSDDSVAGVRYPSYLLRPNDAPKAAAA